MTRRDPRRAELYRRLDAACEARRLKPPSPPHSANSSAPPPAEAPREEEESNSPPPIVYFRQRYWECYRSLTGMDSNTSLVSAEDSICPRPEKRQLIVSDEDDGDRHSPECAYEIVPYKFEEVDGGEDEQGTNHFSVPSKRRRQRSLSVAAYAVQCSTCEKWRFIPTKQKYEELRAQIQTDPFMCERASEWKPDVTCNNPSDVSQDGSWLWAIDQHNIPQPPPGFERLIAIRGEGCTRFADVYYGTPSGKKLRSSKEIENYLKENPEHVAQGVKLSHFSFKIPAPARQDYVRKRAKTNGNDDSRKEPSKPLLEEGGEANRPVLIALYPYLPSKYRVEPVAWLAPPTHKEPMADLYNGSPPELLQPEPPELLLPEPPELLQPELPERKLGNLLQQQPAA